MRAQTFFRDSDLKMRYAPRGNRRLPSIIPGQWIPQPVFSEIRRNIAKAIRYWGSCYLLAFPGGELMIRRNEPTSPSFLVGKYSAVTSAGLREDIFEALHAFGYPVPDPPPPTRSSANPQIC